MHLMWRAPKAQGAKQRHRAIHPSITGKKINGTIQEKSIRTSPLPLWTGYREPASEVKRSLGRCHIERPQTPPLSHWWEPLAFSKAVGGLHSVLWVCRAGWHVGARRCPWGTGREDASMYPGKVYAQCLHPGHFTWGPESPPVLWDSFGKGCRRLKKKKRNPLNLLQIQLYYRPGFS